MNKVTPTLRVYLTDFVNTSYEDQVIEKLSDSSNVVPNLKVFIWYDKSTDKITPINFIKKWEKQTHINFKTIIRPELTNKWSEFIWFDILPYRFKEASLPGEFNSRFTYLYSNGSLGILNGLEKFNSIYKFVNSEVPIRKQKRNDYEDSNRR